MSMGQPSEVDARPDRRSPAPTNFLVALLLLVAYLAGCVQGPAPKAPPVYPDEYLSGPSGEPISVSYTFPGDSQPTELTAELYDGIVLIEGDIALGTLQELTSAALTPQSHGAPANYWPATTVTAPFVYEVPYAISDDFSQDYVDDIILPAIQAWIDNTNLRLVERTTEADYFEFVTATGRCNSAVGRKGGRQELRLDESACTQIATVVHEIGHVIGLKHEQQRPDRDDFVEILIDNVDPTKTHNFTLYGPGLPLGDYGYTSIMHYPSTAFGIIDDDGNQMTTIKTLGDPIAPATTLTAGDLAGVRRLYPEAQLPFATIINPSQTTTRNEGDAVVFWGDAVISPTLDDSDLVLSWTYDRAGIPFTFASTGAMERVVHRFCDGVHDVTMSAYLPGHGEVATETVRVIVNDLGMTNPPPQCPISISIDEPIAGSVYQEGANIALAAVIADDHPETDAPLYPVTWRLDDPVTGSIVGTGLQSTTKLGAGQHTIYATYGAARDSVRVTVTAVGTPPTAAISSPADESVHDWEVLDNTHEYLQIQFSGAATDAQDGALTGASLVWGVRTADTGSYVTRGTGTNPTLRFPMQVGHVRYDVRLTATDSDGMTHSVTIQVVIYWPPT